MVTRSFAINIPSKPTTEHRSTSAEKQKLTKKKVKGKVCLNLFKLVFAAFPTIVFGIFTVVFTIQQNESARATRAQDQQQVDEINRRTIFKEYIDDMKEILLNEDFEKKLNKSLLHIRIHTLNVLQYLDNNRKRDVILFLYENQLLQAHRPVKLDLRGANLNGLKFVKSSAEYCNLALLYLPGVYANGIVFDGCLLSGSVFDYASMNNAVFRSCNVVKSSFQHANLTEATFKNNHLYGSNFVGAHLSHSHIEGGYFQGINLANTDLYKSSIDQVLLDDFRINGVLNNIFTNGRHPNGSFPYLIAKDLVQNGQAKADCHMNHTYSWIRNPVEGFNRNLTSFEHLRTDISIIDGHCFYTLGRYMVSYQNINVSDYSLLIDQEQAMFNLSTLLGLKIPSELDEITLMAQFADDDGSTDYRNLLKKAFKNPSNSQTYSIAGSIPPKTRYLITWFSCDLMSPYDQKCYFDQVTLYIFRKNISTTE